jgi:hypothetical protein
MSHTKGCTALYRRSSAPDAVACLKPQIFGVRAECDEQQRECCDFLHDFSPCNYCQTHSV